MGLISGFLTELASFCEGCSCHEEVLLSHRSWQQRQSALGGSCGFKGRRAPELAAGELDDRIEAASANAISQILTLCRDLSEAESSNMFLDWNAAIDRIVFEVQAKTSHWRLPWRLCVCGHPNEEVARAQMRVCRDLYAATEARLM